MLRSSTKQKLPTNFDAISKNVKILKIGPVEPKLWKIRHKNVFTKTVKKLAQKTP